ncbi:MAG: hypothetical protein PHH83_01415 [Patescibacteria group bacterium]|nr:hypothetical protein [Patescibacteria group bacterium]
MKKILFLLVALFCCFPAMFFADNGIFNGKDYISERKNATWYIMSTNPKDISALITFDENVDFLRHIDIASDSCAVKLKKNWDKRTQVLVQHGNVFDVQVYGGVKSKLRAVIGDITIGSGFKKIPAVAWRITAEDKIKNRNVDVYWFEDGLSGKKQCNNICVKFRKLDSVVYTKKTVVDTVYIYEQKIIYVDSTELKLCAHVWGWLSGASDKCGEPFMKNLGNNGYSHQSYKSNDNGIYSYIASLGGKICFKDNLAIIGTLEGGYQDGPFDFQSNIGLQWQPIRKNYFEMGWRHDYREFSRLKCEHFDLDNGGIREKYSIRYIPVVQENGIYLGYETMNEDGQNHFQIYGSKCLDKNPGTTSLKGSLKLEPDDWYIFAGGGYQWTPSEMVGSQKAPKFEHISFDGRLGRSITSDWLLFLSRREIYHNQNQDHQNEWSEYKRGDLRIGAFYRPQSLFGINNLYTELIVGYSKAQERAQNSRDRKDDFLELKLTLFWNISSKYLH